MKSFYVLSEKTKDSMFVAGCVVQIMTPKCAYPISLLESQLIEKCYSICGNLIFKNRLYRTYSINCIFQTGM